MGMTMTQKILAAHAGLPEVHAGDLIEAGLDVVLGNDVTTPVAVGVFEKAGFTEVFDKDKIVIALDHYTPCKDIKSAELCVTAREFAKKHGITPVCRLPINPKLAAAVDAGAIELAEEDGLDGLVAKLAGMLQ